MRTRDAGKGRFLLNDKMKLTQSGDLGASDKSRNFQKKLNMIENVFAVITCMHLDFQMYTLNMMCQMCFDIEIHIAVFTLVRSYIQMNTVHVVF